MQFRMLGNSGIKVAPLGLGGNVFGWTASEAESFKVLDAFVERGFNLIDTADIYSTWVPGHKGGESETIIGKWLKKSGKRNKVVIATKVGGKISDEKSGLSRKHILASIDESLARLQTDFVDLYQSHRDDLETPQEETLSAFAEIVKAGKVRALGASNFSAPRLEEALAISRKENFPRYETLQPLYNLYDREEMETSLEPLCLRENLAVINFYSLASGFLTGKYRREEDLSKSVRGAGSVKRYFNEKGLKILSAMDTVGKRLGATPTQISIAWLLTRPAVAAPLASATSVLQLEEILKGTELEIDDEGLALLNGKF